MSGLNAGHESMELWGEGPWIARPCVAGLLPKLTVVVALIAPSNHCAIRGLATRNGSTMFSSKQMSRVVGAKMRRTVSRFRFSRWP
jgi:hypothetical protein